MGGNLEVADVSKKEDSRVTDQEAKVRNIAQDCDEKEWKQE